jgi:hypothetical protein
MIHARSDYNERFQDAAGLVPPDEPVFLIRGQDIAGHGAVRAWARLHHLNGGSDIVYQLAMRHADKMESWAREHGKNADIPAAVLEASADV